MLNSGQKEIRRGAGDACGGAGICEDFLRSPRGSPSRIAAARSLCGSHHLSICSRSSPHSADFAGRDWKCARGQVFVDDLDSRRQSCFRSVIFLSRSGECWSAESFSCPSALSDWDDLFDHDDVLVRGVVAAESP